MKRFGLEWFKNETGKYGIADWVAVRGRFTFLVWKFGDNWQNCVEIDYPYASSLNGDAPYISQQLKKTLNGAMQNIARWADLYEKLGPPTYEESYMQAVERHPMYRTEEEFLDQLFYTIGNGYCWLDGALVVKEGHLPEYEGDSIWHESSNKSYLEEDQIRRRRLLGPLYEQMKDIFDRDREPNLKVYPADEKYSKMFFVPDDVKEDWLNAAHLAICNYAKFSIEHGVSGEDRVGNVAAFRAEHNAMANKLLYNFEKRFGDRLWVKKEQSKK